KRLSARERVHIRVTQGAEEGDEEGEEYGIDRSILLGSTTVLSDRHAKRLETAGLGVHVRECVVVLHQRGDRREHLHVRVRLHHSVVGLALTVEALDREVVDLACGAHVADLELDRDGNVDARRLVVVHEELARRQLLLDGSLRAHADVVAGRLVAIETRQGHRRCRRNRGGTARAAVVEHALVPSQLLGRIEDDRIDLGRGLVSLGARFVRRGAARQHVLRRGGS
ncbi:hypothetical protein PENTCL1PPCAC_7578, partial [Pristionchus entomophagus]